MRSRGRRACLCTALLETFTPAPVQSEREEVKLATALGKAAAEKQAAAPAPSASAPSAAAPTTWRSFFGQQANKPAEYAVPAAVGALKAADKPAGAPLTLSKEVRTHRTLGGGGGPARGLASGLAVGATLAACIPSAVLCCRWLLDLQS